MTSIVDEIKKAGRSEASIVDAFPGMVYQRGHKVDWTISFVTAGCLELTGYRPEELINSSDTPFDQLIHPDDVDIVRQQIDRAISERKAYKLEYRIVCQDGRVKWVVDKGEGIFSADDAFLGLEGALIELGELSRQQIKARRYARIVEHIQLGLYVYRLADPDDDRSLTFIEGNPGAEQITGIANEELKGRSIDECFPGLRDLGVPQLLAEVVRTKTPRNVDKLGYENDRLSGKVWSFRAVPLPEQCVGVAFEDLTERQALEEQVLHSQKMEVVGQLAGGIAHDFNNLLTGIIGSAELLRQEVESDLLDQIERCAERAADLTRRLLLFSRLEPIEMRALDLNDAVWDSQILLKRTLGADIDLEFHLDPELEPIMGDSGQITQVLMNLAVNARDAMEEGGQLTIETANIDLDEEYARTQLDLEPGQYTTLSVSDTGSGIDRETLTKIFDPFFTTKKKGKGTGLGLSTVHGIVTSHGGKVHVYSEPDHGTTFRVYFPRSKEEIEEEVALESQVRPTPTGQAGILVVEDDSVVRDLIERILEGHGYSVTVAGSAAEARAELSRMESPPQLVVSDVVLPDDTGPNLAAEITKRVFTPILFISGYTDRSVTRRNNSTPHTAFLQKPFTPQDLLQKVHDLIEETR